MVWREDVGGESLEWEKLRGGDTTGHGDHSGNSGILVQLLKGAWVSISSDFIEVVREVFGVGKAGSAVGLRRVAGDSVGRVHRDRDR
jgi:hypothetical protein